MVVEGAGGPHNERVPMRSSMFFHDDDTRDVAEYEVGDGYASITFTDEQGSKVTLYVSTVEQARQIRTATIEFAAKFATREMRAGTLSDTGAVQA